MEQNQNCDVTETDVSESGSSEEDENSESSSSDDNSDDDSGDETEDYDSSTDEYNANSQEQCVAVSPQVSSESEFDETAERCPICLARLRDQKIGSPESCDHNFCLECILEWSKNVNTCPVDRQVFNLILVRYSTDGVAYKQIPVRDHQLELDDEPVQDNTYCEVCGRSDREDRLLLCDGCDLGYHLECLDPPLASVPRGDWFCVDCASTEQQQARHANRHSDDHRAHHRETHPRSTQQIARTIVAERVRNIVSRNRGRRFVLSTSESDLEENTVEEDEEEEEKDVLPSEDRMARKRPRPTSSVGRPAKRMKASSKKKKRKSRKKRKRKSTKSAKKLKDGTTSESKKHKRKRKRKCKGKKRLHKTRSARTKRTTPTTVKIRLADRLGITNPPTGRQIPVFVKSQNERLNIDTRKAVVDNNNVLGSLSILGTRDDLDPFNDPDISHSASLSDEIKPSTSAVPNNDSIHKNTASQSVSTVRGFDLLGSILNTQNILLANTAKVTINRDGSLKVHQPTTISLSKASLTLSSYKRSFSVPGQMTTTRSSQTNLIKAANKTDQMKATSKLMSSSTCSQLELVKEISASASTNLNSMDVAASIKQENILEECKYGILANYTTDYKRHDAQMIFGDFDRKDHIQSTFSVCHGVDKEGMILSKGNFNEFADRCDRNSDVNIDESKEYNATELNEAHNRLSHAETTADIKNKSNFNTANVQATSTHNHSRVLLQSSCTSTTNNAILIKEEFRDSEKYSSNHNVKLTNGYQNINQDYSEHKLQDSPTFEKYKSSVLLPSELPRKSSQMNGSLMQQLQHASFESDPSLSLLKCRHLDCSKSDHLTSTAQSIYSKRITGVSESMMTDSPKRNALDYLVNSDAKSSAASSISSSQDDVYSPSNSPVGAVESDGRTNGECAKDKIIGSDITLANKQQKFKKLEMVAAKVKAALKYFYCKGKITKEQYKDIMRHTVPKICNSRDTSSSQIQKYIEKYITSIQK